MPLSADAKGVYPIAPTPFFDDGSIDTASIDRLVDFYQGCGCTGVVRLVYRAVCRSCAACSEGRR